MKKHKKRKSKIIFKCMIVILLILLTFLGYLLCQNKEEHNAEKPIREEANESVELEEVKESKDIQNIEDITENDEIIVNDELRITEIESYSGRYVEDGSNDEVSDITSIIVTNAGDKTIQYAEISLYCDDIEYYFPLSTLKPGDSVQVLEAERKPYDETIEYNGMSVENVAYFEEELNILEDTFKVQPLDGGFNITNISEKNVTGKIVIYFKNRVNDIYLGGITYRGRVEGGLKAGEIRQIMTDNFSESETEVMFITIVDE